MTTFSLIVYVTIEFSIQAFVADTGLTFDDCRRAQSAGVQSVELFAGVSVDTQDAIVNCEIETQVTAQ